MNWNKKGLIYQPTGEMSWSKSHAQVPVPYELDNCIRVLFSTRDESGRSNPGFVDLDKKDLKKIIQIGNRPILSLGKAGEFDDCGVMPSWMIYHENKWWLYYIGWNVRNTIPYHNSVGLAFSKDGLNFEKFSNGPLWDRNYNDPHYSGTSCVLIDDNGVWRNWYLSCTEWREVNGKMEPRYHIKYAESKDGINWIRNGKVAIDYRNNEEAGIVKASVIKEAGIYKMWYSYRNFSNYRTDKNNSYRIGYAESLNGIEWKRMDDINGLDVSSSGWDSLMVEYPHVMNLNKKKIMFYNGNGFGQSGFGYAEEITHG